MEDVNLAQLQKYLGKSKMVMDATKTSVPGNGGNQSMGGGPTDGMQEKPLPDMNAMLSERGIKTNVQVPQYDDEMLYEDAVSSSNLPPHIKKAMLENKIDQPNPMGEAPALDPNLVKRAKQHMGESVQPKQQPLQQKMDVTGGLSKETLKETIKEVLSEMMMESISETAVKRTLKKMMTEGKLKVKK